MKNTRKRTIYDSNYVKHETLRKEFIAKFENTPENEQNVFLAIITLLGSELEKNLRDSTKDTRDKEMRFQKDEFLKRLGR